MRRTWIIAGLLILMLLGGLWVRDTSSKSGAAKVSVGRQSEAPQFPDPAESGLPDPDAATSPDNASSDSSGLVEGPDPAAPRSPEVVAPRLAPGPSPAPEIPGTRFVVSFSDYRVPYVAGADRWQVVSFRDMLVGCRAVQSTPRGGPLTRIVYRAAAGPTAKNARAGPHEEDPDALVSVAVFLVAVPFDRENHLIPGIAETYGGEVHTTVGALMESPHVSLVRARSGVEFTAAFPVTGAAASAQGGGAEYSGNFGHAGAAGRWAAEELARTFGVLFPVDLEPFLDKDEYLRFPDCPFALTANAHGEIRFHNWPDGMTLPGRVRRSGDPGGTFEFSEPESLLVRFGGPDRRVIPSHRERLEYAPGPQTGMPPIEVRGMEFDDAVVLVEEPWLSASATYSAKPETWHWSVRTLGSIREGTPFSALLIGSGIEPAQAHGRYGSSRRLLFFAHPARREQRLAGEIIVDPARRLEVPLIVWLTMTWRDRSITREIRLIARQGRYSLEIPRSLTPASLELAIDTVEWADQLRSKYRSRRGTEIEPIWIVAELVAAEGGRRRYEVIVHSHLESWSIGEFFDRFDL